jgi:anti-sigma regulatory factor (Ser/Thr protein kinase)
MNRTKGAILSYVKKYQAARSHDLAKKTGLSRQIIARHLSDLIAEGLLVKQGSTKSAVYLPAKSSSSMQKVSRLKQLKIVKKLEGLQEDIVFNEIALRLGLKKGLSESVYSIFNYAFTEMLNNAIDHSGAKKVIIVVEIKDRLLKFSISETGIGIFFNVMKSFHLKTEFEALDHLIKGRQTTFPERHSGQGVFFTSRIADKFFLRSHKIMLTVDNTSDDLFAKEERLIKGTTVTFEIKTTSRKKIKDLFDRYASEDDYAFDRADYRVKLLSERSLLSRSQAKRILAGLNIYRKMTFDFAGVREVGQSFADEIFRVFAKANPDTEVLFVNANEVVAGMILRAIRSGEE